MYRKKEDLVYNDHEQRRKKKFYWMTESCDHNIEFCVGEMKTSTFKFLFDLFFCLRIFN